MQMIFKFVSVVLSLFLSVCLSVYLSVTVTLFKCGHRRPRQTLAQYQLTLLAPPKIPIPIPIRIPIPNPTVDPWIQDLLGARAVGGSEDTLCWPTRSLYLSLNLSFLYTQI